MNNKEHDIRIKGEDIFAAAGKRMPYRLPEGALDALQDRVMERVQSSAEENSSLLESASAQPKKRRRAWIVALVPTAVAAAVALAVVLVKPSIGTVDSQTAQAPTVTTVAPAAQKDAAQAAVDKAFAQLSAADQQYIIDMYEASERMSADYYSE